jgi:hypothetical protein
MHNTLKELKLNFAVEWATKTQRESKGRHFMKIVKSIHCAQGNVDRLMEYSSKV